VDTQLALVEAQVTLQQAESASTNLGIARAQFEHAIAVSSAPPLPVSHALQAAQRRSSRDPRRHPLAIARTPPGHRRLRAQHGRRQRPIGIATAAYYPNLTLSAKAASESSALQNLFTWRDDGLFLLPRLLDKDTDGGHRFSTAKR